MSAYTYPSGAKGSWDAIGYRYDLIPAAGMHRLAATCHEGAARYGENDWMRGIPISDLLNRAIRHLYLYLQGDRGEDHLAHATWRLFAAMHFEEAERRQREERKGRRGRREREP